MCRSALLHRGALLGVLLSLIGCAAATSSTRQGAAAPSVTDISSTSTVPLPPIPTSPASSSPAAAGCVSNPDEHVYHPDRLLVLNPCVTVTGTIALIRSEADGDYHVRVALDPGQRCAGEDCLDDANRNQQGGDLIVEPVCEHSVTQADAVSACAGYHNPLAVPPVGTHTSVTGPWVLDIDHGWNEIHPVESFGAQMPPAPASPQPSAPSSGAPGATLTVTITASQYGYVAASTAAGAICSAKATLPSGRASTASGLQAQKTAGVDGSVSWTYGTSSSTTHGTGTHTVTCTLGGSTAIASAEFTVS